MTHFSYETDHKGGAYIEITIFGFTLTKIIILGGFILGLFCISYGYNFTCLDKFKNSLTILSPEEQIHCKTCTQTGINLFIIRGVKQECVPCQKFPSENADGNTAYHFLPYILLGPKNIALIPSCLLVFEPKT